MKDNALKHQMDNMTRSGVTELQNGLIEYMRRIIESLIEQSRSSRNMSYLVNKNVEEGETVRNILF